MKLYSLVLSCAFLACAVAQQNGDIRLGSPDFFGRGRLEVYIDDQWGTICYDASKPDEQRGFAQAACQQLGQQNVLDVDTVSNLGLPAGSGAIKLYHVGCSYQSEPLNGPQHVLRCDHQFNPDSSCTHNIDMGVACEPFRKEDKPYDSMVDIVNDISQAYVSQSSGLAQVYLNGEWGPVCNMNDADADSLCRQLGYTNSVGVDDRNITSDRAEMLDAFTCSESRPCLKDCFKYPKADAAVSCNQMYSYITCTFDPFEDTLEYGTQSTCAYRRSNKGKVAGAVIGTLLILATIVIVAVLVVCLFYPSCKLYKIWESKKLPTLSGLVGKGGTKYDSI